MDVFNESWLYVRIGSKRLHWSPETGLVHDWRKNNPGFDE